MVKNQKNLPLKINALGHAYNDTYLFIVPLLLPFFRLEFSLTYFQSGLILTLQEALRSISSLVFGSVADRYDHKYLIISLGFIISSVLLGSVIWLSNTTSIITALLLMAISVSTFHPLATAMVGEKATAGKQGRDLSLFSAAGTLGSVIISLLFGWLVQIWGWRTTCLIIALPGFWLGWSYIKIKEEKIQRKVTNSKINHRNLLIIYFLSRGILCLGTRVIFSFLPVYVTSYVGLKAGYSAWIISIYCGGLFIGLVYAYRLTAIPIFISFLLYILLYQKAEKQESQSRDISSVQ